LNQEIRGNHRDPQVEQRLIYYLLVAAYDEFLPVQGCPSVSNLRICVGSRNRDFSRIRHVHWAMIRI
jgi:hypothetical protein